jgi:hypothetical protein
MNPFMVNLSVVLSVKERNLFLSSPMTGGGATHRGTGNIFCFLFYAPLKHDAALPDQLTQAYRLSSISVAMSFSKRNIGNLPLSAGRST